MREVKRSEDRTSLDVVINHGVHRWTLCVSKSKGESFAFYSDDQEEWNIDAFCRTEILSDEAAEKLADEFIKEFGNG